MTRPSLTASTVLVAYLLATAATSSSASSSSDPTTTSSNDSSDKSPHDPASYIPPSSRKSRPTGSSDGRTCSLYLAPTQDPASTDMKEGAKVEEQSKLSMGVYAGTDLSPHTRLAYSDLVIPIVEVWSHIMHRYAAPAGTASSSPSDKDNAELATRDALDVISQGHHGIDYHMAELLWEPRHFGGVISGTGYDSKALAPGLGSLVRGGVVEGSDGPEANIGHGQVRHERAGVGRGDPSAGSFTYYHDLTTYATKPIKAGDELYEDFGQHYYSARAQGGASSAATGPPTNDSMDGSVDSIKDDLTKKDKAGGFLSGLWGVVQDSPVGSFAPKVFQKLSDDLDTATADNATPSAPKFVSKGTTHHEPEWLAENGRCLDNIRSAESNLEGAGRGAFATRPLAAGEVIGPAPLVHITDRSLLDIREPLPPSSDDMSEGALLSDTVVGKQLLLNYCFGHNASTMLLCNVGVGTGYINHASTRSDSDGLEPNAEFRWSSQAGLHNASWLEMTPDELDNERSLGLMLEYVATRDIEPGEEILIDYGREWEEAWEEHLAKWKPQPGSDNFREAADLNEELMGEQILTIAEQYDYPYPATVETSCYYHYVPRTDEEEDASENGADASSPRIVRREWQPGMETDGTNLRACRILNRFEHENGVEEYTVRVLNNDETHHDALVPDDERLVVTNMPRHAIVFTDRMYTTDQHLPNAFRHEVMIPDEIMPESWRNKHL